MAPVSTPTTELQIIWSAIRDSSITTTRMYSTRFGSFAPINFSTVMCHPILLMGEEQ